MNADTVRRLGNGTIDFDFYRRQAAAIRRQTLREVLKPRIRPVIEFLLISLSVIVGVVFGVTAPLLFS